MKKKPARPSRRGGSAPVGEPSVIDQAREHQEELERLAAVEPAPRRKRTKRAPKEPDFVDPVDTGRESYLPGPEYGGAEKKRTTLAEVFIEEGMTREDAKLIVQGVIGAAKRGEQHAIIQLERWRVEQAGADGDGRLETVVEAERALLELARKYTKAIDRGEIEDDEDADKPS